MTNESSQLEKAPAQLAIEAFPECGSISEVIAAIRDSGRQSAGKTELERVLAEAKSPENLRRFPEGGNQYFFLNAVSGGSKKAPQLERVSYVDRLGDVLRVHDSLYKTSSSDAWFNFCRAVLLG